ncbi:uncharacterized protein (DUF2164 family) [Paenibacillus sp. V4I3]|uniref:DUF2164 domain-containing protein n=1 Tax=unclassified Paenibacillus TaxID=185978 RepID=UPI002785A825|nr:MULTISPECIES: DUF2164 domain-containing protein [unclassified Paenibacillus]MDQ0875531.1 uncharacterized protein (DUF2164 family) [Paenibacillus sp. V4I3]MDQ0888388.1 uncharacterized protein (DUF2164 family) [Paenibacillus sp. V4I9]
MKPLKLAKEEKELLIEDLQGHLELDHNIELGRLASEQLIDYMLQQLAAPIYNQAIEDAGKTLMERMSSLEEDLYAMKMTKKTTRR